MTETQKLIKILAIVLAACLIIGIICAALAVLSSLSLIFGPGDKDTLSGANTTIEGDMSLTNGIDVNILDVELEYAQLIIIQGDEFKVESSDPKITAKITASITGETKKLTIREPHRWIHSTEGETVTVYVPKGTVFDKIEIESGAGSVTAEYVTVKDLSLDLGAGKTEFSDLTVTQSADIESGAGIVKINGGAIKDLDLDSGVGKVEISSILTGNCSFSLGIGSADIKIIGNKKDYTVKASSGIGTVKIDGTGISNDVTVGDGEHVIRISGGIGSAELEFSEN